MNTVLVKALIGLVAAGLIFARFALQIRREATAAVILQLLGSVCLVIVVLTHMAEALHVMPFMGWGEAHSAGHYLDLTSAVLAIALFSTANFLRVRTRSRSEPFVTTDKHHFPK